MNVCEIVMKHLKENGYDGLCNVAGEPCGCGVKDLMPCGEISRNCEAAHKRYCERCGNSGECDYQAGYEADECFYPHSYETEDSRI